MVILDCILSERITIIEGITEKLLQNATERDF